MNFMKLMIVAVFGISTSAHAMQEHPGFARYQRCKSILSMENPTQFLKAIEKREHVGCLNDYMNALIASNPVTESEYMVAARMYTYAREFNHAREVAVKQMCEEEAKRLEKAAEMLKSTMQ